MPLDYILEKPDYVLEEPWEKEEKEKAEELSEEELKKRIEEMERCYIEGFTEQTQMILYYSYKEDWKKAKKTLNNLIESYERILERTYGRDFEEYIREREYLIEIKDIYGELKSLIRKIGKKEEVIRGIDKISDLSRRWVYRLNLYRNLIGKGSKNYEVKKLEDPTYDEELRKY